jgi:hypothetical protein
MSRHPNEVVYKGLEGLAEISLFQRGHWSPSVAATGETAKWCVYYRHRGRKYYDIACGPTVEDAKREFLGWAREIGWKVEIIGLRPTKGIIE